MPKYVGLFNWTEEGLKGVSDTVARYRQARAMIESMGGSVESIHWTMGPYDIVTVVEAPDDETVSAIVLRLASQGNLQMTTMRAFTEDEMGSLLAKMG